jgi:L-lactate dehydrogenase
MARIAVVGAGNVGTTFAYALLLSGLASEIVLVDADPARAEGEAMDLNHAVPFSRPVRVRAAALEDCRDAAITVVAAGFAQKPGETRLDLLRRNAALIRDIAPRVARGSPQGVLLVATNPVDILTLEALRASGLPRSRVIGSGTTLDTARFRYLLGEYFSVDARNVHAYVIGEHGDSEVPVWSHANIAGMPLDEYCRANGVSCLAAERERIFVETRDAAARIIRRKGATYYAVAAGLVRIVESILRAQRTILTVSTLLEGEHGLRGVCLSLPAVLDRGGVDRVLRLELDPAEEAALQRSARILQEAAAGVG